jgi:hypothetical protein
MKFFINDLEIKIQDIDLSFIKNIDRLNNYNIIINHNQIFERSNPMSFMVEVSDEQTNQILKKYLNFHSEMLYKKDYTFNFVIESKFLIFRAYSTMIISSDILSLNFIEYEFQCDYCDCSIDDKKLEKYLIRKERKQKLNSFK